MVSYVIFGVLVTALASLASATIKVDPSAVSSFKAVSSGSKRYALFKLSADFSNVEFVKAEPASANFDGLVKDLDAAKTASEARFAVILAPVQISGATQNKLIFIVWTPLSVDDAVRKQYKDLYDDFKEALGAGFWLEVLTGSIEDLNLASWIESRLAGYGTIESSEYYDEIEEVVTVKTTITIETTVTTAYNNVAQGLNGYAIFGFSGDFASLKLIKQGAKGADFAAFLADLQSQNDARYAVYSAQVTIDGKTQNKLIFILWLPSTISDQTRLKYSSMTVDFQKGLKGDFWFNYVAKSPADLNLKTLISMGKGEKVEETVAEKPIAEVEATIDNEVKNTFDIILKGTKRYALFKLSKDLSKIVLDKSGPSGADFSTFIADLVEAQKTEEGRFAVYMAPVTIGGKLENKLIFFNWIPLNVPEKLRLLYKKYVPKLKQFLKGTFWMEIEANSAGELNLDALFKTAGGDTVVSKGDLGGDAFGQVGEEDESKIPDITLESDGMDLVKKMLKGGKRYLIFAFAGETPKLQLKKSGDLVASFDDLIKELKAAKKAGEGRYAIFLAPVFVKGRIQNKLILINWAPVELPAKQRQLYLRRFVKVKKAFGIEFWMDFTAVSDADLNLKGLVKIGNQGNLKKVIRKHSGRLFPPMGGLRGGEFFGKGHGKGKFGWGLEKDDGKSGSIWRMGYGGHSGSRDGGHGGRWKGNGKFGFGLGGRVGFGRGSGSSDSSDEEHGKRWKGNAKAVVGLGGRVGFGRGSGSSDSNDEHHKEWKGKGKTGVGVGGRVGFGRGSGSSDSNDGKHHKVGFGGKVGLGGSRGKGDRGAGAGARLGGFGPQWK